MANSYKVKAADSEACSMMFFLDKSSTGIINDFEAKAKSIGCNPSHEESHGKIALTVKCPNESKLHSAIELSKQAMQKEDDDKFIASSKGSIVTIDDAKKIASIFNKHVAEKENEYQGIEDEGADVIEGEDAPSCTIDIHECSITDATAEKNKITFAGAFDMSEAASCSTTELVTKHGTPAPEYGNMPVEQATEEYTSGEHEDETEEYDSSNFVNEVESEIKNDLEEDVIADLKEQMPNFEFKIEGDDLIAEKQEE